MPELPEVETVVRELQSVAALQKIAVAEVFTKKIRFAVPKNLERYLAGQKILSVSRRAKYILVHLANDHMLVIHLGMSGRIYIHDKQEKIARAKHDHFLLTLSNGKEIVFNDPRRFGLIDYVSEQEKDSHNLFSHLGPEPFAPGFNAKFLKAAFSKKKVPAKVALMDQTLVVGVGNIYASEALFDAGVDPRKPAGELTEENCKLLIKSIRVVLKRAIAAGGSTLKDYRKTNGELGHFQHKFSVYDRAGKACGKCTCDPAMTGGVEKITQAGRSTFYCPRKQV